MTGSATIDADWLKTPSVQKVFDLLEQDGDSARIVGGAVRNHFIGQPVSDLDFATTALPQVVMARAQAAGIKAVPTGIDHGTVTVVLDGVGYEVTTLRADIETDGRRAVVSFTRDYKVDAGRRDFTINALYTDRNGVIDDPCGGLADIGPPVVVRFIGEARARIAEDYLRILRLFRFFAWYGQGRPDAAALKACVAGKDGLADLSAERIWQEMSKLFAAPDPSRALLWMRQTGVLTAIMPESEKWGIDEIHGLMETERSLGWKPDAVLRLMAIVPPNGERMAQLADRWKLPNLVRKRLLAWAEQPAPSPEIDDGDFDRLLYRNNGRAIIDALKLDVAKRRARQSTAIEDMACLARLTMLLERAEKWKSPQFPLTGQDLLHAGFEPGKDMGDVLKAAEDAWVKSRFMLAHSDLLAMAVSQK